MSNYVYFFIAVIPSIVLHEVSHGYVAYLFGDSTAKESGRLTLNPLKHIDPFGTILLPALLLIAGLPAFGYAKPVPVNVSRLRDPRRDALYVALVGPFTNILLSAVGYAISELAIHVTYQVWMFQLGAYIGLVNLTLAVFNLLPIPPLDGSAIIERFVPRRHLADYYRFRAAALPIVMILVILDAAVFHVGTSALVSLQNWWLHLLV